MKRNVNDLIQYRINRSDVTFKEAKALAEIEQWNGVINRLYYVAFYAVSALLLRKEIYTKTHSGLKSKFNEEIIKKGKLPSNLGEIYNQLLELRANGDYGDFIVFTKEEVEPLIERTKKLINEIKKLINNNAFTN